MSEKSLLNKRVRVEGLTGFVVDVLINALRGQKPKSDDELVNSAAANEALIRLVSHWDTVERDGLNMRTCVLTHGTTSFELAYPVYQHLDLAFSEARKAGQFVGCYSGFVVAAMACMRGRVVLEDEPAKEPVKETA